MKKLMLGLIALTSISAFASDYSLEHCSKIETTFEDAGMRLAIENPYSLRNIITLSEKNGLGSFKEEITVFRSHVTVSDVTPFRMHEVEYRKNGKDIHPFSGKVETTRIRIADAIDNFSLRNSSMQVQYYIPDPIYKCFNGPGYVPNPAPGFCMKVMNKMIRKLKKITLTDENNEAVSCALELVKEARATTMQCNI